MFAVYTQNQFVYNLSQLTSAISFRSSPNNRINHQRKSINTVPSSFLEIQRHFHLSSRLTKNDLFSPVHIIATKKHSRNIFCHSKQKLSVFRNFELINNNGILSKQLQTKSVLETIIVPLASTNEFKSYKKLGLFSKCHDTSVLFQQIRSFRTERNINAESVRSPGIISRIKRMFPTEKISPFVPDASLDGKNIFTERVSTDDAQKIKVAFAEGYMVGQGKSPNKFFRILKGIHNFVLFSLLVGSAVYLFATASGTVFKLQMGNQVEVDAQEIDITFNDVKGVDEAKQELQEIVEFLKNPEKFSVLGGKLPKGVLLVGPPGTGKTLLARAVAGEAGVPFFHAAGSEFDEILVGQGARRVRDLFSAAKNKAPCVIFIDEIDAVGGKRTNSVLHPYANQTINQLLSEMDGFHQNEGVIVLGATNRREDLDRALLRPGRFDVEVHVSVPDFTGRKDILNLYLSKIKSKDIDVDLLARGTTGFTGADIENLVNLAALRAAIDGSKHVTMRDLENARDKVLMGPERKTRIPDDETNQITAYHEGGHAVVAYFTKDSHPIHKVTIIPRGPSLGHTAYIPKKEHYHTTKSALLASMDTMMGGRAAEELIFGPDKITSGAASDLKQATAIATHMVKEWGMSDKVGLRTHENKDGSFININELGPNTSEQIDTEIKKILQDSYERAKNILKTHAKEHKQLAEALLKYETLEADDVKAIMNGKRDDKNILWLVFLSTVAISISMFLILSKSF